VREWLMENGFQGKDGQQMPFMPDDFVQTVSQRYIELYEKVTGMKFEGTASDDIQERVRANVERYLASLGQ
jgi:phosphoribosylaminoimidazole-succinocarboxamide synthase